MIFTTFLNLTKPDLEQRQKLICRAANIASQHSIYDNLSEHPVLNIEHPVAFQSLLEAMNNKVPYQPT